MFGKSLVIYVMIVYLTVMIGRGGVGGSSDPIHEYPEIKSWYRGQGLYETQHHPD